MPILRGRETIADIAVSPEGTVDSHLEAYLVITPSVSGILVPGGDNRSQMLVAVPAYDVPEELIASRTIPRRIDDKFKKSGGGVAAFIGSGAKSTTALAKTGKGVATMQPGGASVRSGPAQAQFPAIKLAIALTDAVLATSPLYTDFSGRGRALETQRGRSYEFARMETGTAKWTLDNRDSSLNPEN